MAPAVVRSRSQRQQCPRLLFVLLTRVSIPAKPRCCLLLQLASEVAVLQRLHHETLVSHLFLVDQGARFSIVMEWAGEGLRSVVQQQQPQLGEDAVRHIVHQLTNSLVYLHHQVSYAMCAVLCLVLCCVSAAAPAQHVEQLYKRLGLQLWIFVWGDTAIAAATSLEWQQQQQHSPK